MRALLLLPLAAVHCAWTHDGGTAYRQNAITLPPSGPRAHSTYAYTEPDETAVSEVEEYFLQSPLVSSRGSIFLTTDTCTVVLLADPATFGSSGSGASRAWLPLAQWSPLSDPAVPAGMVANDCELAGLVLDSADTAYVLDRGNHALHAIVLGGSAGSATLTQRWSAQVNKTAGAPTANVEFDDDVSMIALANGKLWVPLMGSYFSSPGIALLVDASDGSSTLVPLPTAACAGENGPADYGSAALTLRTTSALGVVQLSSTLCGRLLYGVDGGATASAVSASYPPGAGQSLLEFEMGEHSHPLFDPTRSWLYYINFQPDVFSPLQKLCCLDTTSSSGADQCGGTWPNVPQGCLSIPLMNSGDSGDPLAPLNFRCAAAPLAPCAPLSSPQNSAFNHTRHSPPPPPQVVVDCNGAGDHQQPGRVPVRGLQRRAG